jgi:hypothetical protein
MPRKETVLSVLKEIRNLLKPASSVIKLSSKRFVDNGDKTITDLSTGLMWGKTFPQEMTWKDADQACKDLNFESHKDWHLPSVEELRSIIDYTKGAKSGEPAIDIEFFPDTKCSWYWTSTPAAWVSGCAWCVGFYVGDVSTNVEDGRLFVRPVRSCK